VAQFVALQKYFLVDLFVPKAAEQFKQTERSIYDQIPGLSGAA
jgi:predicted DNA-binding protein YlxM (UPF0122 family)